MKKYIILLAFISSSILIGQNAKQTFIELGIINETPLRQFLGDKYKKIIYKSDTKIYAVQENNGVTEIFEYNSDKSFANFYFIENEKLYKVSEYEYFDRNLNELNPEVQEMIKDFYTIQKDSTKMIGNLKCFKVVMKVQDDDSTSINMYVSEDIPNLPNHFPLPSNVLNAEPLEIELNLMGNKVLVGILKLEEGRSIEDDYNFNFEQAYTLNYTEYEQK